MQLDKATLTEVHRQLTALLTRSGEDRRHYAQLAEQSTDQAERATLLEKSRRAGWSRDGLDQSMDVVSDMIKQA